MDMARVLAIDIGGTTIRVVRADESGLDGDPWTISTQAIDTADDLAKRIESECNGEIDAIGVAAAGVVDREAAELVNVANYPEWNLTSLAETFGAPLALENDADAGALGVKRYADGVDEDADLAYLTISTGIGAGVLRDGRLVPGVEAGFANVNWDGDVTHSDVDNPWDGYASGGQFPIRLREWLADDPRETVLTGGEDPEEFFAAVYQGDEVAREYYTRLKRINAAGIGTITDLFAIDRITVGGGVALNNPELLDYDNDPYALEQIDLESHCVTSSPIIELTEYGDDIELYGAAAAALEIVHS